MSDKTVHRVTTRSLLRNNIRNYTMFLMLALIMIVFAFLTNGVNLNSRNFTNIFIQNSYVLLLAVGMVQVMILGCIDLSVGSVCAFVGAISAMVYNTGAGMFTAVLVAVLIGVAIGAFQGFWVAYMKMPAFIVTLAGMLLFRGLTYIITNVTPVGLKDDGYKQLASGMANIPGLQVGNLYPTALILGIILFVAYAVLEVVSRKRKIRNGFDVAPAGLFLLKLVLIGILVFGLSERFATYRGLPRVVILLGIVVFIFNFMMKNTVLGRYIYAVGGNARSAKLSGINSELVTFTVFCIMGCLSGLAGVVFTGYMNSALPQAGNMFEMDAIASCYIGGVSASGGIGTIIGVIVGGLVMAAINNGMSLMNIGSDWQYVVKALILLFAVFYDVYSRRKSGLG
ncbi:sugar ABC transporter permease [Breznakiella homolactica]|uniref:Xylose transport system permease protein XylH n=1 Tax=Breznakiella homolactica TaxID=2798577 RepID=A0A7T7XR89_9SPIR|nr:sugar ABC transporter permease [Breznakiella homolactica]QQO11026.1 sugar ABC transporter permease [Breznakiella homolactica]